MTPLRLFLLALSLALPMPALAARGGQDLGGGNAYEPEFRLIGSELNAGILAEKLTDSDARFNLGDLDRAVREVQVFGSDDPSSELRLRRRARHALNSLASQAIVFSNEIWSHLSESQKRPFVLHEYLRFVRGLDGQLLDDAVRYEFSTHLIGILKARMAGGEMGVGNKTCRMFYKSSNFWGLIQWDAFWAKGQNEDELRRSVRLQCFQKRGERDEACSAAYAKVECADGKPGTRWECRIAPFLRFSSDYVGRGESQLEAEAKAASACVSGMLGAQCSIHVAQAMRCRPLQEDE